MAGVSQFLRAGRLLEAVGELRRLQELIYAAIPAQKRVGRGITWVMQRLAGLYQAAAGDRQEVFDAGLELFEHLDGDDLLVGAPLFMLAASGEGRLAGTLPVFERAAAAEEWVVREFAAGAFRSLVRPCQAQVLPWLDGLAQAPDYRLRRFCAETLRPVAANRWLLQQPQVYLPVLQRMFGESHPYPRTSVGNNLSDLSRRQPELVFGLVAELAGRGSLDSSWIAYRACRNLVKKEPQRVLEARGWRPITTRTATTRQGWQRRPEQTAIRTLGGGGPAGTRAVGMRAGHCAMTVRESINPSRTVHSGGVMQQFTGANCRGYGMTSGRNSSRCRLTLPLWRWMVPCSEEFTKSRP
jgi:3-methyladenine DNA glycosylase AlkC